MRRPRSARTNTAIDVMTSVLEWHRRLAAAPDVVVCRLDVGHERSRRHVDVVIHFTNGRHYLCADIEDVDVGVCVGFVSPNGDLGALHTDAPSLADALRCARSLTIDSRGVAMCARP